MADVVFKIGDEVEGVENERPFTGEVIGVNEDFLWIRTASDKLITKHSDDVGLQGVLYDWDRFGHLIPKGNEDEEGVKNHWITAEELFEEIKKVCEQ